MKKAMLAILLPLLLSVATLAGAAGVPGSTEPQAGGPEIWTVSVYNNTSNVFDVGDVLIWDIDASTGDNDNWVNTTTTADYTGAVAGVVWPADIAAGSAGTIAIWGVVQVDLINGHAQGLDGYLCTSGTAGSARDCASASNSTDFCRVVQLGSGTSALCFVSTVSD